MTSKELVTLLMLCVISRVLSLSCIPCVRSDCDPKFAQGCTAGLTRDVCGCCDKCAQDLGEVCGGPWGTSGSCGRGLECYIPPDTPGGSFQGEGTCIDSAASPRNNCDENGEPTFCAFDQIPHCGSDGIMYGSSCEFFSAQCKNPGLEVGDACLVAVPACEAPGSGCPNGLCKERCDYKNGEYNSPFQTCGGSNCTCCVAAASCHGNGNPCEGVIGGTCRGECEPGEVEQGFCSPRVFDVAQCRCCRKVGNPSEFTLDFERFIVLDQHKGATWQQARNLCRQSGYELAQPQIDVTILASYLQTNHGLTYYWLGGKGQGSNIAYLSGQVIGSSSPLWRKAEQGFQTSTDYCVYIRDDGNPNPLGTYNCQDTTYMTPLCEGNEILPPPPAAPPADFPALSFP